MKDLRTSQVIYTLSEIANARYKLTLDVLFNVIVRVEYLFGVLLNETLFLLLLRFHAAHRRVFSVLMLGRKKNEACGIITNVLKREAPDDCIVHVRKEGIRTNSDQ